MLQSTSQSVRPEQHDGNPPHKATCPTRQQLFLPSYVEQPQPANARIQSVTSFLWSWLLVTTSGLAWANMPRPLKIRLIIILILLVQQSSKLSLPTTSSSTMMGSVSLKNWTKIPSNKPILSRLPGGYKRTARTANQLALWQRVIDLKYAPCAARCDWYYMSGGWISRMTCPSRYTRLKRAR